MTTEPLTLDPETADQLQALADKLHRPSKTLLQEAVRNYLELQNWQMEDIHQGLVEADADDFVTTDDMQTMVNEFRPDKE